MLLDAIDWQRPWLAPLRDAGQAVARQVAQGTPVWQALNTTRAAPVRFVPHGDLPAGVAYESHVFEHRQCPTREGLHDFFNGLCWLHFPLTKTRLNQLQAAQIARHGVQPVRGAVRDALTLLDENAAFLQAPDALWAALLARDWPRLFLTLRPLWSQARLVLFGHALLEKLVHPRKAVTAHVYRGLPAMDSIADLDAWVAADLGESGLASKPFVPLPVLGVPGWWPANASPDFYDDATVFRPRPAQAINRMKREESAPIP